MTVASHMLASDPWPRLVGVGTPVKNLGSAGPSATEIGFLPQEAVRDRYWWGDSSFSVWVVMLEEKVQVLTNPSVISACPDSCNLSCLLFFSAWRKSSKREKMTPVEA